MLSLPGSNLQYSPSLDVFTLLEATEEGLTSAEVERRLGLFGPNKLEAKEVNPILQVCFSHPILQCDRRRLEHRFYILFGSICIIEIELTPLQHVSL